MDHLPRGKLFTLNQFTRLSHSRFSKGLFTFCLFVLKVWRHENYYCSSMTANKFSARQPTPSYWRILSHCETLRASNLENKQKNITLYCMLPYTNTLGVVLIACEHHSPKSNAKESLRNLLWRLKIDYELFSWRMEVALLSLCDCPLLSIKLHVMKLKGYFEKVHQLTGDRKYHRINCSF